MAAFISLYVLGETVWTHRKNDEEAIRLGWSQCSCHWNGYLPPGAHSGYNYCPCVVTLPNLNPNVKFRSRKVEHQQEQLAKFRDTKK